MNFLRKYRGCLKINIGYNIVNYFHNLAANLLFFNIRFETASLLQE